MLGAIHPKPDSSCTFTAILGAAKRYGFEPPPVTPEEQNSQETYFRKWYKERFTPIVPDELLTYQEYLLGLNVTRERIKEMVDSLLTAEDRAMDWELLSKIKSHQKQEFYPKLNLPRWINARSDVAKMIFGPLFKIIINKVNEAIGLIKYMPQHERGKYMKSKYRRDYPTWVADATSYEAHFIKWRMMVEVDFYEYMMSEISVRPELAQLRELLCGVNKCDMRDICTAMVVAVRMSGETNTSLGNTLWTLFILDYHAEMTQSKCVRDAEGDDNVSQWEPPWAAPTLEDYKKYGWLMKLEKYDCISKAPFCSLLFDYDSDEVYLDPFKTLMRFGWMPRQYNGAGDVFRRAYLRVKAISLYVSAPNSPITSVLARMIIRNTLEVKEKDMRRVASKFDWWEKFKEKINLSRPSSHEGISQTTRETFFETYNITPEEQLNIERKIIRNGIRPFSWPYDIPPPHGGYWQRFVGNDIEDAVHIDYGKRDKWAIMLAQRLAENDNPLLPKFERWYRAHHVKEGSRTLIFPKSGQ